ncbi:polyadenylate-binding protein RBP45C-like [Quercus robur]|uniref:polyadenylate-binding protein RBP45C-like n=1 Tax=Quercus robur TaxID=38942 RepID=UPI002162287D|nr:polyadenylate-binding protein RBP45C-like [Quercus robur]
MMQQPASGVVPQQMPSEQQYQQAHAAAAAAAQQQQQQQQWMMQQQQQQQQQVPQQQSGWAQPQQAQAQAQYSAQQTVGSEEIRSLWIGDLLPWMEENYLLSCFAHTGEVVSAKVIRNKQTQISDGYGFVEFVIKKAFAFIRESQSL